MCANHAPAKDSYTSSRNTRDAAKQDACTAFAAAHRLASGFNGEPASNFAHRGKQGQGATVIGDGFISNGGASTSDQALCLFGVGGKM